MAVRVGRCAINGNTEIINLVIIFRQSMPGVFFSSVERFFQKQRAYFDNVVRYYSIV